MIKKLFLSDIGIACDHKNYRKLLAANFTIIFAIVIFTFFSTYNFFQNNMELFYMEIVLLSFVIMIYILLKSTKNMVLIANLIIGLAFIGCFLVVYISKAADYTPLWAFLFLFYATILLGHKKGLIFSSILFVSIYCMMWHWIGEYVSTYEFVRYIFISLVLMFISFLYEYSSQKYFMKLEDLNTTLQEMTRIDALTTLFNRKYFDEIFTKQVNINKRDNKLLVFAIMDIDYFKKYNDTYGHQAGDSVLKEISQLFKASAKRAGDYVFRVGGEEFTILLNVANEIDSLKMMDKIRKDVESLEITHEKSEIANVITISIGLYIIKPDDKNDYETIYRLCDNALYKAKERGRNRVESTLS